MENALRHGWLKIPGLQTGDRELAEQMEAVWPAVAEAQGKTVLDLGCSEGLLGLEFAKAGATRVLGLDSVAGHLEVARELCRGYAIEFEQYDLNKARPENPLAFDIVLALGSIHKVKFPGPCMRFAARSAGNLLLLRCGRRAVKGIITAKLSGNTCDAYAILEEEGFTLERVVHGPPPHSESVEYFRRKR